MESKSAVIALAALAQDSRLAIFRALVVEGPNGLTPGRIGEATQIAPSALSFHLKELMHAGLVTQERAGRFLIYRAAIDQMNALLGYLTENCCNGMACLPKPEAVCC